MAKTILLFFLSLAVAILNGFAYGTQNIAKSDNVKKSGLPDDSLMKSVQISHLLLDDVLDHTKTESMPRQLIKNIHAHETSIHLAVHRPKNKLCVWICRHHHDGCYKKCKRCCVGQNCKAKNCHKRCYTGSTCEPPRRSGCKTKCQFVRKCWRRCRRCCNHRPCVRKCTPRCFTKFCRRPSQHCITKCIRRGICYLKCRLCRKRNSQGRYKRKHCQKICYRSGCAIRVKPVCKYACFHSGRQCYRRCYKCCHGKKCWINRKRCQKLCLSEGCKPPHMVCYYKCVRQRSCFKRCKKCCSGYGCRAIRCNRKCFKHRYCHHNYHGQGIIDKTTNPGPHKIYKGLAYRL